MKSTYSAAVMMEIFSPINSTQKTISFRKFSPDYIDRNIIAHQYQVSILLKWKHKLTSHILDSDVAKKLSLEEVKIKAEEDKIQKLANEHKSKIREILKSLKDRYKKLLMRNSKLLPSQVAQVNPNNPFFNWLSRRLFREENWSLMTEWRSMWTKYLPIRWRLFDENWHLMWKNLKSKLPNCKSIEKLSPWAKISNLHISATLQAHATATQF